MAAREACTAGENMYTSFSLENAPMERPSFLILKRELRAVYKARLPISFNLIHCRETSLHNGIGERQHPANAHIQTMSRTLFSTEQMNHFPELWRGLHFVGTFGRCKSFEICSPLQDCGHCIKLILFIWQVNGGSKVAHRVLHFCLAIDLSSSLSMGHNLVSKMVPLLKMQFPSKQNHSCTQFFHTMYDLFLESFGSPV